MSAEHLRLLFDALPDALLVVASDGSIIDANQSASSFMHQPVDRLVGRALFAFVVKPPSDLSAFLRACSRTRERVVDALRVDLNGQAQRCRVEGFLLTPKSISEPATLLLRLLPAETTTGKFLLLNERLDHLSREVATRRRVEEDLRHQRELLEVTLKSIGDGVIVADETGEVLFMNPVAEQLTKWTLAEARNQAVGQVFRIVDEHTGQPMESPVEKVLREGTVVGLGNHTLLIAKDRSQTAIDDSGAPIKDSHNHTRGVVLVFRDVSERRRTEQAREMMLEGERAARAAAERAGRLKDEFLATLSHELRTPLNAILGYATLLQMGRSSEKEIHEALETIIRNARQQAQLIDDLLDMNRIISGKVRLEVQVVDLSSVIDAALETTRPSADAKHISIRKIIDPSAGTVRGDPNRLQQVVWNLLSNAVKFTPKYGKIQVSLEKVDSHVEIIVSDTGQGISAEFLPSVFDRFRQADASTTRQHGGLGLGLSIVKQLVELHGGTAHATSPGEGQGSTFVVSLPLAVLHINEDGATSNAQNKTRAAFSAPDLKGIRVLVVDDELDACQLVVRVLTEFNADVRFATSASEALRILSSSRHDVLISDLGMPGEDGFALMRKVRALSPEHGGAVPAIALSAFARSEDRRRAALAGFQTHLAKPIEATELVAVVASLAGRTGR